MCSNPITFIQALTKTLNELLCTLHCHLIIPKPCHKSKWSNPSSTGIKNTTLVTFWKHTLKTAYCHLIHGEERPAITATKCLRRFWLFTFSLAAGELMATNQQQDWLSPTWPWLYHPDFKLLSPKSKLRKRLSDIAPRVCSPMLISN